VIVASKGHQRLIRSAQLELVGKSESKRCFDSIDSTGSLRRNPSSRESGLDLTVEANQRLKFLKVDERRRGACSNPQRALQVEGALKSQITLQEVR